MYACMHVMSCDVQGVVLIMYGPCRPAVRCLVAGVPWRLSPQHCACSGTRTIACSGGGAAAL